ncbi:MAG TPA: UPF0182 family protein [Chloroflexota bacterium]|nr:UPF0182 family protein [Chloroflexota bacterium]
MINFPGVPSPLGGRRGRTGARRWGWLFGLALLAITFGGRVNAFYVDYLWYSSVGYPQVFFTGLWTGLALFSLSVPLFFLLFLPSTLAALAVARRLLRRIPSRFDPRPASIPLFGDERPRALGDLAAALGGAAAARWTIERLGRPLALFSALALALVFGLAAAGSWETARLALNATTFGVADPVFSNDVSFYVFTLPLLDALQSWLYWALLLTLLAAAALYALALYAADPTMEHAPFYFHNQGRAMRSHLLALGAVLLLVVAAGFWIGMFDVLFGQHNRLSGATFADVHARIPATQALIAATILTSLLTGAAALRRDYTLPIAGGVLMLVALVVGRGILPIVVQRLQVEPAELAQELPYIQHSIDFTRRAFALGGVQDQTFPADETVKSEEIRADPETVANIRLWDPRPLRETYNQVQSIRPYYVFDDVDVDRYRIDGRVRQVMLSARELVPARLGQGALTWVNRRLQYTHGYGVAMSPVNEISQEGLPRLLIQDLPPTGRVPVTRPEVYYGEQTGGYVIVNAGAQEFDYPSGDQNVFSTYGAESGIEVGPVWRRALLAWYFADFNLLVSSYVRPDSRILFRRGVRERAQRVVPFAKLDRDPYLVVAGGELFWMIDGFTLTNRYPYALRVTERLAVGASGEALAPAAPAPTTQLPGQPVQAQQPFVPPGRRYTYSYVRNSVKVAVNAYDGSVRVYLSDSDDPIAAAYERIFPGLFQAFDDMPLALREHVRYPEDLFRVQAEVLRTYHVTDPQVFYNGEDVWSLAFEGTPDRRVVVEPYYLIMRLPGETQAEFVLVTPFTPRGRENMTGWLAARNDAPHYGKLQLYKFPRDRLVFGPAQVRQRLSQDPTISQQITLWDQQGSEVLYGNLLVVPIGRSTLYVQPIYLQAEQTAATINRLPELKRIILSTGNRVVMEPTLEDALSRLLGPEAIGAPAAPAPAASTPTVPRVPAGVSEAARAARETYQRALDALRGGDFARFGEELRRLEEQLSQLEQGTP